MVFNAGQTLPAATLEQRLAALETHVTAFVSASGTMTGAVTPTLTGTTVCGAAFTAPASGRVKVTWSADISTSTTAGPAIMQWEIRNGSTVGSGTVAYATNGDDSIQATSTAVMTPSRHSFVSGLTAGAAYNIQGIYWTSGGVTGTFGRRRITVEPA